MKNRSAYLILLLLPITLLFTANLFTEARTPYFLLGYYDPSYVYLLNSLNITQFIGVGHVDHPGTPLQELGAVVISLTYFLAGKNSGIVSDVFQRPEIYLRAINFSLILLNAAALFILGLVVYKSYKSIFAALFIQLTPFYSTVVFFRLSSVTPEAFLIFTILVLLIITFKFINETDITRRKEIYYITGFAITIAAGISAKINFFPLLIIPLTLIRKGKNKFLFLLLTVISFFIFVIPAIPRYKYFINWVINLFIHNELYGEGAKTIINTSYFFGNIKNIFIQEKFFAAAFLLMIISLIVLFFRNKKKSDPGENKLISAVPEVKLLTGIVSVMILQILIVAKHYYLYYMLPAFMLTLAGLFCVIIISNKLYGENFRSLKIKYIFSVLIIIIVMAKIPSLNNFYYDLKSKRDEAIKINNFIEEKFPDKVIVCGTNSENKESAFAYASQYTGSRLVDYRHLTDSLIPVHFYFDSGDQKIYCISDITDGFKDNTYVKNILNTKDKIIFQNNAGNSPEAESNSINTLMTEIKDVYDFKNSEYTIEYSNDNGDKVYSIKLIK